MQVVLVLSIVISIEFWRHSNKFAVLCEFNRSLLSALLLLYLLRFLEGQLSPIMCQPPPGLCQLQKWWQPGSKVPATLQAAAQPGSGLWPGQRWAAPWVRKQAQKVWMCIDADTFNRTAFEGFFTFVKIWPYKISEYCECVFLSVCACFRSLTTSGSWCVEATGVWAGSCQRLTNSTFTNR